MDQGNPERDLGMADRGEVGLNCTSVGILPNGKNCSHFRLDSNACLLQGQCEHQRRVVIRETAVRRENLDEPDELEHLRRVVQDRTLDENVFLQGQVFETTRELLRLTQFYKPMTEQQALNTTRRLDSGAAITEDLVYMSALMVRANVALAALTANFKRVDVLYKNMRGLKHTEIRRSFVLGVRRSPKPPTDDTIKACLDADPQLHDLNSLRVEAEIAMVAMEKVLAGGLEVINSLKKRVESFRYER
jgi:hypothetical protein